MKDKDLTWMNISSSGSTKEKKTNLKWHLKGLVEFL